MPSLAAFHIDRYGMTVKRNSLLYCKQIGFNFENCQKKCIKSIDLPDFAASLKTFHFV